jgi:hypothetical protein
MAPQHSGKFHLLRKPLLIVSHSSWPLGIWHKQTKKITLWFINIGFTLKFYFCFTGSASSSRVRKWASRGGRGHRKWTWKDAREATTPASTNTSAKNHTHQLVSLVRQTRNLIQCWETKEDQTSSLWLITSGEWITYCKSSFKPAWPSYAGKWSIW